MKLSKPKVSVLITFFKKKHFIEKTLNSVLNQTYKNFEIIFVYDDEDKKDLIYIKKLLQKFKKKRLSLIKKT